MRKLMLTLIIVAVALAGCNKRRGADKVVDVKSDDAAMNAAIGKARSSVNDFIRNLQKPAANQTDFAVKVAFTQGKHTEHMWLGSVSYDGSRFHGTINNDPERVTNVKLGQKSSVAPNQISDWMYVENGKLVGGYTIRVLRDALSAKERKDLDQSLPFRVE